MGPYLSAPIKDKRKDTKEISKLKYVTCSMQGWRKTMEDSHISITDLIPAHHFFAVMDGHGGSEVAQYTQTKLPQLVTASPYLKNKQWNDLFTTTFKQLDDSILTDQGQKELIELFKKSTPDEFRFVSEAEIYKHVGCTLCAALITENEIIVANSGDSRCILGVNGHAVEMSFDHKPENDGEKKRITAAKGFVEDNRVNGNLNLSRSIGDYEYKSDKSLSSEQQQVIYLPDVKVAKLTPEVDFMVIACDGIWEVWESEKVAQFVYSKLKEKRSLSDTVDDLFEKIVSTDCNVTPLGCDNMTCIILQFKNNNH